MLDLALKALAVSTVTAVVFALGIALLVRAGCAAPRPQQDDGRPLRHGRRAVTALPFTRRRPSPRTIDLTAFRLVEPCPAHWDDTDTRPRPAPTGVAFWGRNLLFWACFAIWIAFLLKVA